MSNGTYQRLSFYFSRESKENTVAKECMKEPFVLVKDVLKVVQTKNLIENNTKKDSNTEVKTKKEPQQPVRRSARNLLPELKEKLVKPDKKEISIDELPTIEFKGKINYAEDFYSCAAICDTILQYIDKSNNEIVPIGFDLEWPFSFQTGSGKTALAQICMSETECYLLHIFNIRKLPATFCCLLSHPKVKLVGVNIKNDIWKIGRDFKEFPSSKVVENNCLDSGVYLNSILNRTGRWSLERLTVHLLKKKIDKNPSVRRSKWHILPLSNAQKNYAATDAYVSWLLHMTIEKKALELAKEKEEEIRTEVAENIGESLSV